MLTIRITAQNATRGDPVIVELDKHGYVYTEDVSRNDHTGESDGESVGSSVSIEA